MKKNENPEGEHLEVCEGRSSPSDTPFLATRFWCGDGCGIAEEMRRAGGVSLRGFVEVLGRREFALEKKLSLFERSEFDNFFSGFSKISTP